MERPSVSFDSLVDIPGFKVILKTVLHSQIQQLVEQLSEHTNEEVVFLTASSIDGKLYTSGSEVGKNFIEQNNDIKSSFLAFCLKRHHEQLTSQGSGQTLSQVKGPVPVKLTGSGSFVRHSPYSRRCTGQRTKQVLKKLSLDSTFDKIAASETEGDKTLTETLTIELADDNDNDDEKCDDKGSGGFSGTSNGLVQKSKEILRMEIQAECKSGGISEEDNQKNEANTSSENINLDSVTSENARDYKPLLLEQTVKVEPDLNAVTSDINTSSCSVSGFMGISSSLQVNDSSLNHEWREMEKHYKDWSSANSTDVRHYRKRRKEIPIFANLATKQTQCPYCEQNYANHANLKRHIRQHEGIYPYQCKACEKKFTDATVFKRHKMNKNKSCWMFYSDHNNTSNDFT